MKNLICFFIVTRMLLSCDGETESTLQSELTNVIVLKVDFLTSEFEAGKELEFPPSESFTISTVYNPPRDFGDIQLYYSEFDEKLFDGTIHWAGCGERSYPEEMDLPENFETFNGNLEVPESDVFEKIQYHTTAFYPETIDYSSIWNSIKNLELIKKYRKDSPKGKIYLFLYTPSVGIGNPADWDWYLYFKN